VTVVIIGLQGGAHQPSQVLRRQDAIDDLAVKSDGVGGLAAPTPLQG